MDGALGDALAELAVVLSHTPDDTEALYLQAVAQRYTGNRAGALETLHHLKDLAPGHGRAHQEEGHAIPCRLVDLHHPAQERLVGIVPVVSVPGGEVVSRVAQCPSRTASQQEVCADLSKLAHGWREVGVDDSSLQGPAYGEALRSARSRWLAQARSR